MGAPIPKLVPVDGASAEALLSSLEDMPAVERRKHASIFNYWLSIRGNRQLPPIRDLDPLEISDAGPWSVLLELIGSGENAVIRHLGQAIKLGVGAETIARAPNPSLLSCIHAKLPVVASAMQALAFEDSFETDSGTMRCWVTLLPFSASGSAIDYVYGFVSFNACEDNPTVAETQQIEEVALEPGQVPLGRLDEDPESPEEDLPRVAAEPAVAGDEPELEPEPEPQIEPETLELVSEPKPELDALEQPFAPLAGFEAEAELEPLSELGQESEPDPAPVVEPEAEAASQPTSELEAEPEGDPEISAPPAKAGFSSKFFDSLASVGGFYGRVVHAEATAPAEEPTVEEIAVEETAFEEIVEVTQPTCEAEGTLQSKLTEVRAMAEEARQAELRSQLALYAGLSAAYDFALDAEAEPEEYLRLVEGQGLKIQLRSPMKPVVKLAFADTCNDATIAQLEAVLAWALKMDLPRGTLAERIEAEGGIGSILEGLGKAA